MTVEKGKFSDERPLEILGISAQEERAYRCVLAQPGATVQELAQALALTPGKTQRMFDSIEAKGLVTHSPERPRRYIPAAPDIALKALVHQRQESLQRAQVVVEELREQTAVHQRGEHKQMVELITSREAERQAYEQIQLAAQDEVLGFVRPPILISRLEASDDQEQHVQRKMQAKGVCYRGIVDKDFLDLPGAVQCAFEDMKIGEEIRVVQRLPLKMILADHHVALIPLNPEEPDSPVLLVRSSALLESLYALFEILWERATSLTFTHAGRLKFGDSGSRLPEDTENILSLMAAGLNDKKSASEMGISLRTFYRRVADLMNGMDAQTRFQFGYLVARQLSKIERDRDHTLK